MNNTKEPHIMAETFFHMFKWFSIVNLIIVLAILGLFRCYIHNSFNAPGYHISQEQSGTDNVQGLNNVSKTNR